MINYRAGKQAALLSSTRSLVFLGVILGSFCATNSHASTVSGSSASGLQPELLPAKGHTTVNQGSAARVYGNSVIPGGVRGSSELTSALGRDRIVKAHYANFDAANAYVVHVKDARMVHVSYRMGNEIYWTKNKVRLAKGEALLTDGKSFIRARCGNRIADVPQSKISIAEPAPAVLDTVLAVPAAAASMAAYAQGGYGQPAAGSNQAPNNRASVAAAGSAGPGAFLQGGAPVSAAEARRAAAARATSAAAAELAPGPLDRVSALAEAINKDVLAVLVTSPAPQLTAADLAPSLGGILAIPVTLASPPVLAPAIAAVKATETVLASVPSTLFDRAALPKVLLADQQAVELPEPGSLALLMFALALIAVLRTRGQRK